MATNLKDRVGMARAAQEAGIQTAEQQARDAAPTSVLGFVTSPRSTREFARLLGTEEMAERWLRIALTECRRNPELLECSMESFAGALMQCAQLKLEPGPPLGLAWIIPYNNRYKDASGHWQSRKEAQFQLGYPGVVQLGMRSGQLATLAAHEVCELDEFDFDYLTGERHHKPPKTGARGKAYGYYCFARYANGGDHFLYMTREQVEAHRDRYSPSAKWKKGPWYDDDQFDAMARKTAIKLSRAFLPASPDFVAALSADERTVNARGLFSGRNLSLEEEDFDIALGSGSGAPQLNSAEEGNPQEPENATASQSTTEASEPPSGQADMPLEGGDGR